MIPDSSGIEGLLRELAPQVRGALVRRYGQFHLCEDASQEALLWPTRCAASSHGGTGKT